jgi:NAD dependent epimerase/dehydratase
MNWTGRRVFVTGAGGFIGSHLCEALLDVGADVTAMLHYSGRGDWGNLEYLSPAHKAALAVVAGNIEDRDFVLRQMRGQQIVLHLAALIAIPYSYVAPLSYVRTNIEGTLNVLEAARLCNTERIVHTSTSETYGTAQYTPIDEKHPLQGQSPYSASKIGADKIAESYCRSFDLPVAIIRPFNTYGPRQSARAIIPTIISQALSQPAIRLGALDPVRDLVYVRDTVRGFLAVAGVDAAVGEVLNLGTGTGVTIGELAALILEEMGCDKPIISDSERVRPAKSEVFTLLSDASKAKSLAGWEAQVPLREGLREAIAFVSAHAQLYKTDRYVI